MHRVAQRNRRSIVPAVPHSLDRRIPVSLQRFGQRPPLERVARKIVEPALELRGFAKTRLLQPGESETLTFTLTPRDLASFDEASSSWKAEAGTYEVKVGASSADIRQTATFTKAAEASR